MPRKTKPLPADAPVAQRAAHAFHQAACEALGVTTQTEVARAIGETRQGYSNSMTGIKGSLERVHGWIVALSEKGHHLALLVSADSIEVHRHPSA